MSPHLRTRIALALAAASLPLLSAIASAAQPAFPGAEGFGALTSGGRGGDVYHVTSLADTNTAGTLRYGISHAPSAGRTIVFDVSGTIALASNLSINHPNLTIAGQTAPGIGVTVTNWQTSVTASNVIVRYMRFRPGDTYGPLNYSGTPNFQGDAFDVMGGSSGIVNNVLVDHLSTSWSIDEDLSATWCNNVTVQNSILAEGLQNAGHDNGSGGVESHSMGSLLRYGSGQITYSHNLYASNGTRNPRLGDNISLDFANNVLYNWAGQCGYSGAASEGNPVLNYRGNYAIAGPNTDSYHSSLAFQSGSTATTIYQSGNYIDPNHNGVLDGSNTGWGMFSTGYTAGTGTFPAEPVPVSLDSAPNAFVKVTGLAGASLVRDSVDKRILGYVTTNPGTGGAIIDSQSQVGGWDPTPGSSRPANFDSDKDGMPDAWEVAHGLNPAVADNNKLMANGYTALETYLYSLAPSLPGDANGDMTVNADDYTLLDRGMADHLAGWTNGDFNGDGVIDASDYLIIDSTYAREAGLSPQFLSAREAQFGPAYVSALEAAVPEPASLSLAALAVLGGARRRRR